MQNFKPLIIELIKNKIIFLLGILVISLFLRIYGLGHESIWLDEGFSIRFAKLNFSQIVSLKDYNPPLFHLVLHWWINFFGDSEFSVRFPSVIFGFLSIVMIYKLGKQIFDKETGILSSLLLGLSVFHIQYSQEARTYSLTVLLTIISMYFFIKLINRKSYKVLIGYILFSILLMYSHIFGLFIIISQNFYFITLFIFSKEAQKLNIKQWILIQIVLITLFSPWVKVLIDIILKIQTNGLSYIPVPSIKTIYGTFVRYSYGSRILLLFFLIISSFSIMTFKKTSGNIYLRNIFNSIESYCWQIRLLNTDKIYALLVWLLMPIILPFIISRLSSPIYTSRYVIVALPSFYLLIANGIRNINYKYLKLGAISIIISFSFFNAWGYYTKVNKEQWRDVAKYIDMNAKPKDLLLFNADIGQMVIDYYSKRTDLDKKPFTKRTRHIDDKNIKELGSTVKGYNRIWLLLSHSQDYKGLIKMTLRKSYSLIYHKKYIGIDLSLFKINE